MKRAGNLYQKISTRENLELAFWRAQRGKSDRGDVIGFRENLEEELSSLAHDIEDGTVAVGDYHYFTINDPKKRTICAASFRERVLHHAIMAVCDAEFERYQIYDSYASRKEKGEDACLKRTQEFCGKYGWFLKLDIHKFFDSVNHGILMNLLDRRFKDPQLLYLFSRIIDSYETTSNCGLPIGNLTSQYFANLYLGLMDHLIKDRWKIPGYVRYMDDFILFADTREELTVRLPELASFLDSELRLELNPVVLNRSSAGIPYLSYRVYSEHLWLSLKARRRFRKKIRMANQQENQESALPLLAFIGRADDLAFRKRFFQEIS